MEQVLKKQHFDAGNVPNPKIEDGVGPKELSTAIPILDRAFDGGLPSGSVVYLYADAKSMGEVFLYQFTQARKTYYFTNERRYRHVMHDIQSMGFDIKDVNFVDIYSEYYFTPSGDMLDNVGTEFVDTKIVEFTEYNLKKIMETGEENINIIFDSFSFYLNLNLSSGIIRRLLNTIYDTSKNLNCLAFLYGVKSLHETKLESEILNSCDVIFDIDLDKSNGHVINRLSIPKTRGRKPLAEIIKFKIEDGINIDTTKDIA